MARFLVVLLGALLIATLIYGCSSGGGEIPVVPDEGRTAVESLSNQHLMGFWQVMIDTTTGTGEIVDLRSSDLIINVLGFMEPPPLVSLNIDWNTLIIDDVNNQIIVDVIFSHPIPDAVFMGFDCRGMVFGPDVLNADGYSVVCSPEFFDGVPFGYMDGLLGAPHSIAGYSGLAAYKYFCDGLGKDDVLSDFMDDEGNLADRGVFSEAPQKNTRHMILDWNNSAQAFFVFNYAVYANYDWPVGDPVDSPDDFDITTANSAEAFCCSVYELANSLFFASGSGGGDISLQVEVWDWQGDITDVTVESWEPGIITQASYDVIAGPGTSKSTIYEFYAMPGDPTTTGDLDLLITVTDPVTFGAAWFFGLLDPGNSMYGEELYNCFKYTTTVIECAPPVPTSITPNAFFAYPGIYDDVDIVGDFFELAGGVTDVYLDDGTDEVHATDINVIDDENMTCDFDVSNFTGAEGLYDLVVVTACEGRMDDAVTFADNVLFCHDFGTDNGGCIGFGSGGYQYNSGAGRWEERIGNYGNYACYKFRTPNFNVPATASDVHFGMRHSWQIENAWDGCWAGWSPNNGSTLYGDPCDESSGNYWKHESGQNYNYRYCYAILYRGSTCIGCTDYMANTNFFWCGTYGSLGTGIWSYRHLNGTENLIGMTNACFTVVFMSDGSVTQRGHEIYELCIWYDS